MIGQPIVIYYLVNYDPMGWSSVPFRHLIFVVMIITVLSLGVYSPNLAYGLLTQPNQFESHTITGEDLKNNPFVAKILSEIEYSKKQVAELQKNQRESDVNKKFIDEQRKIANELEQQALQILQVQAEQNSSKNSFDRFVATVENNDTKKIFLGEFDFMTKRVDAGHLAMKKVLDNGGTWEEAMQEFSKYAAIKHVEMVELNRDLNVKYGFADPLVQADFNDKGLLPDDYIKVPNDVLSHVPRT